MTNDEKENKTIEERMEDLEKQPDRFDKPEIVGLLLAFILSAFMSYIFMKAEAGGWATNAFITNVLLFMFLFISVLKFLFK